MDTLARWSERSTQEIKLKKTNDLHNLHRLETVPQTSSYYFISYTSQLLHEAFCSSLRILSKGPTITSLFEISSELVPLFNTWQGSGSILVPSDCSCSQFLLKAQSKAMTGSYPDFHVASHSIASSTPTKDIQSSKWSWVSGFPSKTCSICFKLTGYDLQKFFTAKKKLINYFSSFHLFPSLQQSDVCFSTRYFPPNKIKIPIKDGRSWSFSSGFFMMREKKQLVCLIEKSHWNSQERKDQNL